MKKEFMGGQLKTARQYRGMTVEQLADKIDVKKQTISLYENDKITPEFDKILNISKVLKFPYDYFMQKPKIVIDSKSTYFRALLTTQKKYRIEQIRKIEHLSAIYSVISEYIDFPEVKLPDLTNVDCSPEEAANQLRKCWNLGGEPIKDIINIVEDNGIIISMLPTSTDQIDAFSHLVDIDNNPMYLIALSSNKESAVRKHFSIAHELGHILMHEWSEDIESLSRETFRAREKEANAFAAALLLPANEFLSDISAFPTNVDYYVQLKKKWKVSISAMIMRAHNLNAISFHQYQYMMKVMQAKGYRTEEPLDNTLVTAPPSMLKNAIQLLFDEDVFSPDEFMDELGIYGIPMIPEEVEYLLDLDKGMLSGLKEKRAKILKLKERGNNDGET